jgi:hypothetical protein
MRVARANKSCKCRTQSKCRRFIFDFCIPFFTHRAVVSHTVLSTHQAFISMRECHLGPFNSEHQGWRNIEIEVSRDTFVAKVCFFVRKRVR